MGFILRVRGDDGRVHDIPAIVGPQGEQGEPGPQGPPGEAGATPEVEALTNTDIENLLK